MTDDVADTWAFKTDRLGVGRWHDVADSLEADLAGVVAEMLTVRTTVALPESWRGEHSIDSARDWISDRDGDARVLLVIESASQQPAGLLVLAEAPLTGTGVDLRIGYLFAEKMWGQGLATELVMGLADWARTQPRIRTLTGGVDPTNRASVRVLEKCGFELIDGPDAPEMAYQLEIARSNEWDSRAVGIPTAAPVATLRRRSPRCDELVARLRGGGLFVQWDWERTDDDSHGLTRAEVRETLGSAGLVDVTVSDAFSISVDDQTMSPIMGYGQRSLGIARR